MFKAVNGCITSEDVSWSEYIGICTDGAAALTGHKKASKLKEGELLLTLTLYIASSRGGFSIT
jgi:hypothetical protein